MKTQLLGTQSAQGGENPQPSTPTLQVRGLIQPNIQFYIHHKTFLYFVNLEP